MKGNLKAGCRIVRGRQEVIYSHGERRELGKHHTRNTCCLHFQHPSEFLTVSKINLRSDHCLIFNKDLSPACQLITVSGKIVLTPRTAMADPVMTNAITEADTKDSSTPEPVEPNSREPEEEQSEYDSSSDEETTKDLGSATQ